MSKDKKGKGADYDVGFGKPPKAHQFKKGTSGNPAGAPSKRKRKPVDVVAILNQSLEVKTSGGRGRCRLSRWAYARWFDAG